MRITPAYAGKSHITPSGDLTLGITPAYAGKRTPETFKSLLIRDHPRVCGEKVYKDIKHVAAMGSPPRMRGKAPCRISLYRVPGITPAYAGKRKMLNVMLYADWDHPRVCGEKDRGVEI